MWSHQKQQIETLKVNTIKRSNYCHYSVSLLSDHADLVHES